MISKEYRTIFNLKICEISGEPVPIHALHCLGNLLSLRAMNIDTIIAEAFNVREENIHDDLVITELEEWDSMAHMFFITKIEEQFGIDLSGDEIEKMRTVKDIKTILNGKNIS